MLCIVPLVSPSLPQQACLTTSLAKLTAGASCASLPPPTGLSDYVLGQARSAAEEFFNEPRPSSIMCGGVAANSGSMLVATLAEWMQTHTGGAVVVVS